MKHGPLRVFLALLAFITIGYGLWAIHPGLFMIYLGFLLLQIIE